MAVAAHTNSVAAKLKEIVDTFKTDDSIRRMVLPKILQMCEAKEKLYAQVLRKVEAAANAKINAFAAQEAKIEILIKGRKLKAQPRDPSEDSEILDAIQQLNEAESTLQMVKKRKAFVEFAMNIQHRDRDSVKAYFQVIKQSVQRIYSASSRRQLQIYLLKVLSTFLNDPSTFFKKFMNIAILGDPGSGKTHYSNLLCGMFSALHIVMSDEDMVKEYTAKDFIAQYAGQTGPKTVKLLNSNLERVVFIDEAYALMDSGGGKSDEGGGASYGKEAITEIVNYLSTHIGQIIVIVAGYKQDMEDLLVSNPGLQRRFPNNLYLEALTPSQAVDILDMALRNLQAGSGSVWTLTGDSRKILEGLYAHMLTYYSSILPDKKDKTKFLAMTTFGNGAGSMVNMASSFQEYIDLKRQVEGNNLNSVEDDDTPLDKVASLTAITPELLVCMIMFSMTFGTTQQRSEWVKIKQYLEGARVITASAGKCLVQFEAPNAPTIPNVTPTDSNTASSGSMLSMKDIRRQYRQDQKKTSSVVNSSNYSYEYESTGESPLRKGGARASTLLRIRWRRPLIFGAITKQDFHGHNQRVMHSYDSFRVRLNVGGVHKTWIFAKRKGVGMTSKQILKAVVQKINITSVMKIAVIEMLVQENRVQLRTAMLV